MYFGFVFFHNFISQSFPSPSQPPPLPSASFPHFLLSSRHPLSTSHTFNNQKPVTKSLTNIFLLFSLPLPCPPLPSPPDDGSDEEERRADVCGAESVPQRRGIGEYPSLRRLLRVDVGPLLKGDVSWGRPPGWWLCTFDLFSSSPSPSVLFSFLS